MFRELGALPAELPPVFLAVSSLGMAESRRQTPLPLIRFTDLIWLCSVGLEQGLGGFFLKPLFFLRPASVRR